MMEKFRLLLLFLLAKAWITVELTWNTETLSYTCCQSKNQLLSWNFTKGANETITELQWFFNDTTLICLDSKTIGFHVDTFYDGRVVRTGTAGIVLKNVSLNDAGKYTLYVKLAEEKKRNVQDITITVVEQVPYHCKPIIQLQSLDAIYCTSTCLDRSQLTSEWMINGTRDHVGIGRYLMINGRISGQAFCCLRGLKCYDDDQFISCMPNPMLSTDCTFKEDIQTRHHDSVLNYEGNERYILTLVILVGFIPAVMIMRSILRVTCLHYQRIFSIDKTQVI